MASARSSSGGSDVESDGDEGRSPVNSPGSGNEAQSNAEESNQSGNDSRNSSPASGGNSPAGSAQNSPVGSGQNSPAGSGQNSPSGSDGGGGQSVANHSDAESQDENHSDDEEMRSARSEHSEQEANDESGQENENSDAENNENRRNESQSDEEHSENEKSGDERASVRAESNDEQRDSDDETKAHSQEENGDQSDNEQKMTSDVEMESNSEAGSPKSAQGSDAENQSDQEDKKSAQSASDNEQEKSDGEEEHENKQSDDEEHKTDAVAQDLFGDADDISDESGGEEKSSEMKDSQGDDMITTPNPVMEDEEGNVVVPEEIPETRIDVEIPKITADLGKELDFVKLPNFLSVETRPFDPQTYEDEIDEDEVLDEEGRARLKLKVENTVRWQWGFDEDGNPVRDSNARVVRWSDGSMSLHLGAEIFDIHKQQLQSDHNHLFIRQGTGLQGQAVFRTKLTFRPHSTDSFTHRKITISVADRSQKIQKIRVLPNVGKDPEAHRTEMIKREEDRLKASIRRESKQRRVKERAQSRGLSSLYLENDQYEDDDDDDEGAISLSAIKNKYKKGAFRDSKPIYSSDSDASDIDERRTRRLEKAKALADSDDEGESEDNSPKKKMARIEESEEEEDDEEN